MSKRIPVFLILGFLEAGKTSFIKDTLLQDDFMDGSKTLIITCEEGEEEYDKVFLERSKSAAVYVEESDELTPDFVKKALAEHHPDRVFLEYNGMWSVPELSVKLEAVNQITLLNEKGRPEDVTVDVSQVIMIANGENFDMYLNNMRSMVTEMFKVSEIVLMNRCRRDMPRNVYRRLLRALNPVAQLVCDAADGEELSEEEELPFDVNADVIEVEDADYAIFHMDVMEKAERYNGKKVHFKAQFCKPKWGSGKGAFIPGRFAMVCCAQDVQFIGYLATADPYQIKTFKNRDWIEVFATIGYEKRREYEGVGPVLNCSLVRATTKPEQDVVTF